MNVDIESLMNDEGINYSSSGKNIGIGWYGVQCPTCGDASNHCAISPSGAVYHCWSCGGKGSVTKIIQNELHVPYNKASALVKKYSNKFHHNGPDLDLRNVPDIILPGTPKLSAQTKRYLRNRGFSPQHLQDNYDLYDGGPDGDYRFRVIIPLFLNHRLVSFLGRDVTGRQDLRYKNLPVHESKLPLGEILFNYDTVDDACIVTEGCMDAMKIGAGAVATLGTVVTSSQIRLLSRMKHVYILFDADKSGVRKSKDLHCVLSFCGVDVHILDLPEGVSDPAEMNTTQVQSLRSTYLGNNS